MTKKSQRQRCGPSIWKLLWRRAQDWEEAQPSPLLRAIIGRSRVVAAAPMHSPPCETTGANSKRSLFANGCRSRFGTLPDDAQRTGIFLLLGRMPIKILDRSGQISEARRRAGGDACRHALYLPDASGNRQTGPEIAPSAGWRSNLPRFRSKTGRTRITGYDAPLLIGLAWAVPVFALEMGGHIFGLHAFMDSKRELAQLLLATPVVLWAGWLS